MSRKRSGQKHRAKDTHSSLVRFDQCFCTLGGKTVIRPSLTHYLGENEVIADGSRGNETA